MNITFTQDRELANRKLVKAGEVYDTEDLNVTEEDAYAYIDSGVAEELD